MVKLMQGAVKWFDDSKKFGFLYVLDEAGQRTGDEVFFHYNNAGKPDVNYNGDQVTIRSMRHYDHDKRADFPRRGETVMFLDEERGDATVSAWVYDIDFHAAVEAFMHESVQYRVIVRSVRHEQISSEIVVFLPSDRIIRESASSRDTLQALVPSDFGLTPGVMRSDLHLARTTAHVEVFSMHGGMMRWHTFRKIVLSDIVAEMA